MINLNTNLSSLITQRSLATSTQRLNQAIEQMTTGFKINHAKDNAANYNITTNMTTKIGAYMVAEDNCAMGLDLLATANGSLDQIADKLQRLRALAVQTSNGTYGAQSKEAINQEANAIVDEIERIYNTTEYNGINVMKGQVTGVEESKFIKDIDRRDTSRMTTLASVDPDKALTSGTYSISTPEELAKLATMTNNGLIGAGTEFVLANNINLNGVADWEPIGLSWSNCFRAIFDGNGYVISNLNYNNASSERCGVFGIATQGSVIKNLGLEEVNIIAKNYVGALAGWSASSIENCYVSNCSAVSLYSWGYAGGIVGQNSGSIDTAYVNNSSVEGFDAGGVTGYMPHCGTLNNVHVFEGTITSSGSASVFVGLVNSENNPENKIAYIKNSSYSSSYSLQGLPLYYGGPSPVVENVIINDDKDLIVGANIFVRDSVLNLQVGVNSSDNSQISLDSGYSVNSVSFLRKIGKGSEDHLAILDQMLLNLSNKQTELGAAQNRLESAIDEISVQYENLVSSRSTLRDADISEVSSEYIRQQILQQASATLMATANQSPSIALQLI